MSVAYNIEVIQKKINKAANEAERKADDITLIAVSKTKPVELMKEAYACGIRDFGENKPQEIVAKYPEFVNDNVRWHLIGTLQKNKVKHIIDKVYLIHSVDSLSLAEEINKRAIAADKIQNVLIQVNISGEDTKSGVSPNDTEELCRQVSELSNIRIKGLMTISVRDYTYEQNKELFKALKIMAENIDKLNLQNVEMKELSMGMTNDYEAAIPSGATLIRVGTAIFGARDYSIN